MEYNLGTQLILKERLAEDEDEPNKFDGSEETENASKEEITEEEAIHDNNVDTEDANLNEHPKAKHCLISFDSSLLIVNILNTVI